MTEASAYETIRAEIDAALGDGFGMPAHEAVAKLSPAAHAVWALDNLLASLFAHRLHIWTQSFAERAYEGPRVIAAIAERMRALDPTVADLLRWTTRWVTDRGVALVSLPPLLWESYRAEAHAFIEAVAEAWPQDLDPATLPAPEPWGRAPVAGPVQVRLTEAHRGRDPVFAAALRALWTQGVEDGQLERFWEAYYEADGEQVQVLRRFVEIDEPDGALARRIDPPDPLAERLGVPKLPFGSLVRVREVADVADALDHLFAMVLDGDDIAAALRAAMRSDPDVVVVEAARLREGDVEMLVNVLATGHLVIAAGDSPVLDGDAHPFAIVDRRGAPARGPSKI